MMRLRNVVSKHFHILQLYKTALIFGRLIGGLVSRDIEYKIPISLVCNGTRSVSRAFLY